MAEWWSYGLSDFLLFSARTYYRLFELYNAEIWPAQLAAGALAAGILVLLRRGGANADRAIAAILAAAWLWVAFAFHLQRYATINWAAPWFAAAFAVEAALLLLGAVAGRLRFRWSGTLAGHLGLGLFLFAVLVQPLIGILLGRSWRQAELFALAPDPTAVGTLGLLLLAAGWPRWTLLAAPVLWCAVTGLTLWAMDAPDALVAPIVAVAVLLLAARPGWRRPT